MTDYVLVVEDMCIFSAVYNNGAAIPTTHTQSNILSIHVYILYTKEKLKQIRMYMNILINSTPFTKGRFFVQYCCFLWRTD